MSGGWFKLDNDSLAIVREYGSTVFAVFAALNMYADKNGECFPKEDTLAELLDISRSTVSRSIAKLRKSKILTVTNRVGDDGKVTSNLYALPRKPCVTGATRNGSPCVTDARNHESPATHKQDPMNKTQRGECGFDLPDELNTDRFREAWIDWETHRKQSKKTITPIARTKQLNKLAEMGHERALAAINFSIEQSYQGIFEPKEAMKSTQAVSPKYETLQPPNEE